VRYSTVLLVDRLEEKIRILGGREEVAFIEIVGQSIVCIEHGERHRSTDRRDLFVRRKRAVEPAIAMPEQRGVLEPPLLERTNQLLG
jgi:hypothetical protein